jgi:hypothetical protein
MVRDPHWLPVPECHPRAAPRRRGSQRCRRSHRESSRRMSLLTRPGPLRSSDLAHLRGVVLPAHPQFIGFRRQAGTEPDDRAPGAKPTGT